MNVPKFSAGIPGGEARGRLVARAVRYGVACFAGYLLGLSAGHLAPRGPGFVVLALIGLVALFLVFRSGAKSQSHAAADAISAADARAAAVAAAHAQATQVVTVNANHLTNPQTHPSVPHVSQPRSLEESRYVDVWSVDYDPVRDSGDLHP